MQTLLRCSFSLCLCNRIHQHLYVCAIAYINICTSVQSHTSTSVRLCNRIHQHLYDCAIAYINICTSVQSHTSTSVRLRNRLHQHLYVCAIAYINICASVQSHTSTSVRLCNRIHQHLYVCAIAYINICMSEQSHTSTSVRTFKLPNTGSYTSVWTPENTAHVIGMGSCTDPKDYHWRQLPQVSFLSRQTRVCRLGKTRVCRDKSKLVVLS